MRPHRIQRRIAAAEVAAVLGPEASAAALAESGIDRLPDELPSGPRPLAALQAELAPAVRLYEALLRRLPRESALAVLRRVIIRSGLVAHGDEAARQAADPHDISLTSPPPGPVTLSQAELQAAFAAQLAFFSCEGELHVYSPEELAFTITRCNWCTALANLGAPELTPFFCETDQLSMEGHPTHDFTRPHTIQAGDGYCDFRFKKREEQTNS